MVAESSATGSISSTASIIDATYSDPASRCQTHGREKGRTARTVESAAGGNALTQFRSLQTRFHSTTEDREGFSVIGGDRGGVGTSSQDTGVGRGRRRSRHGAQPLKHGGVASDHGYDT